MTDESEKQLRNAERVGKIWAFRTRMTIVIGLMAVVILAFQRDIYLGVAVLVVVVVAVVAAFKTPSIRKHL